MDSVVPVLWHCIHASAPAFSRAPIAISKWLSICCDNYISISMFSEDGAAIGDRLKESLLTPIYQCYQHYVLYFKFLCICIFRRFFLLILVFLLIRLIFYLQYNPNLFSALILSNGLLLLTFTNMLSDFFM